MTDTPSPTGTADRNGRLSELSALGGYFALHVEQVAQSRSLSDFLTDPVLDDYVGRTRTAIATATGCPPERIPLRMAASSLHLGVAARLLSPTIGAALCFDAVPALDTGSLRWAPAEGHAPRFTVTGPTWTVTTAATSAQVIAATVLPALIDLGDRLSSLVALSPQVTLGNLTSAANGAVTVLAMSRPHLEPAGRDLVRALLETGPLTGSGAFADGRFRRHSCCLYYQAPGSGLCGDCVLSAVPASAT